MNKTTAIAVVIAVVVIGWLVARPNIDRGAPNTPDRIAENPEGEADPSRMTLGMKAWKWIKSVEGEKEVAPLKADAFTLSFPEPGRFTATTDCNQLGGSYSTDRSAISFSDIYSTKMYCEGSQEGIFSTILSEARSFEFTSRGELIFTSETGGKTTFR